MAARLTQAGLATLLGLSTARVAQWESPTSGHAPPNAGRLQQISAVTRQPLPDSWIAPQEILDPECFRRTKRKLHRHRATQRDASTVAGEIQAVADVLASVFGVPQNAERNAAMFAQRYGVHGPDLATLQACGDRHGMTRERVRQICDRMLEQGRAHKIQPGTARLVELAQALAALDTCPLIEAEATLRPLLGPELALLDARRYANEVAGLALPFLVMPLRVPRQGSAEVLMFTAGARPDWTEQAVTQARRLIGHSGAAQLHLLLGLVQQECAQVIQLKEFRRVLAALPGFEWLGGHSWFWLGPRGSANRIVDRAIDILSVARGFLDIEEIYAGIVRDSRERTSDVSTEAGVVAPMLVIQALLTASPEFVVRQSDDFRLTEPQSPEYAPQVRLGDASYLAYQFMAERQGIASRRELYFHLVEADLVKGVTLSLALAKQPAFRALDRGVFALRGWPLVPERLAEAMQFVGATVANDGTPKLREQNRLVDGQYRFTFVLTEGAIRNRMTGVPAALHSVLVPGAYSLPDGTLVRVPEDRRDYLRGCVRAVLALGAQAGDSFLIGLDPDQMTASIEILPATC
jgi:transcriptional regulator with XRE-family HTH domain